MFNWRHLRGFVMLLDKKKKKINEIMSPNLRQRGFKSSTLASGLPHFETWEINLEIILIFNVICC